MTARAFTLIEMLAVVTILALAAGTLAMSTAAPSARARERDAVARWRDLDARARLLARSAREGEPPGTRRPVLTVARDGAEALLVDLVTRETLTRLALPTGVRASLDDPVSYDRLGRSRDYDVALTGDGSATRFAIDGLTGRLTEVEP